MKETKKEPEKTITFRYVGDKRENTISVAVKDEDNNITSYKKKPDKSGSPSTIDYYGHKCNINEWLTVPYTKHLAGKLKGNHHFEVK